MPYPLSLSISAVSLFFSSCIGLFAGDCLAAEAEEDSIPGVRSPVVGGTAFPSLTHSEDAQAETWRIRRPHAKDSSPDTSQTPLYIAPEVRLPRPGHAERPQPRQSGRERP